MRTKLILVAILFQFLVLAWMAGQREWILRTGPTVWLRTAPVDPRDLFRGDYVELNYEISTVPENKLGPALKKYLADQQKESTVPGSPRYGRYKEIAVYSALRIDPGRQVAEIAGTDLIPPPSGLYLKGRVRPFQNAVRGVSYGIESYFVQQGKGRKLERRAPEGIPDGFQVAMDMEVALGRDGTAVLKGCRWNPLGIRVDIQRKTPQEQAKAADSAEAKGKPQPTTIKVTLVNAGSAPVAVVWPPDRRTLRFQRLEDWTGPGVDAGVPHPDLPPLTDAAVRLLAPRETVTVEIDPSQPEWFVKPKPDASAQPLAQLASSGFAGVRLLYEAPPAAACQGLKEAERIWHEPLASRTINAYELLSR